MHVAFTADAGDALARAERFLHANPVQHNLILTLLRHRTVTPEEGRYWIVGERDDVVGFVFQSPTTFKATVTPMSEEAVEAAVDGAARDADLPGVIGDAATAARFAGRWTEVRKAPARPTAGQRLYELRDLEEASGVPGFLRVATEDDIPLLVEWMHGFNSETGERGTNPADLVPLRVAARHFYLWDYAGSVATAATTSPVAGVVRVQAVYTPPEHRNHGYASAVVGALSRLKLDDGFRCILYTELANPTSNSVYRRLGYRVVTEVLHYDFE